MRIDGLTLDLRERNAWEAFDLGVVLARSAGPRLFLPYTVIFIVLGLFTHLAAYLLEWPPLAALALLWWLKPAADRVALAVLAQAVFGAAPSWRDTLRSLRRIPRTGWLMSFTLGRLDFARSYHLPVRQLEGQTGKAGRERLRLLDRKLRGHAVWLTLAVWAFVFVLVFGINGLIELLAPQGVHAGHNFWNFFGARDETLLNQYIFSGAFVLAECLLEPIYIACGFALYLSRRTALEGWDLEVAFKRMSARIEETKKPAALPGVLTVLLAGALAFACALPHPAWAQEDDDDEDETPTLLKPAPVEAPVRVASAGAQAVSKEKLAVQKILAAPEFNEFEMEKRWRYNGKGWNWKPDDRRSDSRFGELLVEFFRMVGEILRAGIWVIAVIILGWLLYLLARHFGWFKGAFKLDRAKPDVMFGLDLRPESLPDDVPAAARALLARGDMRGAMALLYRASLSVLVHERDVEITIGDTEGDCVRRVQRAGPPALAAYFESLVAAWGLIAYAGRKPELAEAQRLIDGWAGHFAVPREGEDRAQGMKAVPA